MHSQDEIREWLVDQVAEIIAVDRGQIDTTVPFSNYGLSSKDAISLSGDLEDWLNKRLSPTLVYEYPSIDLLSAYLVKDGASDADVADERSLDASTSIQTPNGQKDNQSIIQELEEISDEEAELLLIEKLNKIDRD